MTMQLNTSYGHIPGMSCYDKCVNILFSSVSAIDIVHTLVHVHYCEPL